MLTEAKLEANRANAQHSTGPKTEEGKAKSSRNALRYGIYSMTGLLPQEDPEEYRTFSEAILKDLDPLNAQETELANLMLDLQWRLRRVSARETQILSADAPDYKALNTVSLHGARLKRQYTATLKEFTDLHAAFKQRLDQDIEEAENVYRADHILERPSTLEASGFVCTVEELERWRIRNFALGEAKKVVAKYEAEERKAQYGVRQPKAA